MKVVGVIPARYASTRFPGKPLVDIHGKPMIWWVYQQVRQVTELAEVVVATDSEPIARVCEQHQIKYCMTRDDHENHIARVHEVSENLEADYYICVNGDEPLIEASSIRAVIPTQLISEEEYFRGAMRDLNDPAETIDCANLKLVVTSQGRCIYMSRSPVPYPRGTLLIKYKKYIGIECFNKKALDFFVNTPMGDIERIEDIDHIRFLEHGKKLLFTQVSSDSISVDTQSDLEKVRIIIQSIS